MENEMKTNPDADTQSRSQTGAPAASMALSHRRDFLKTIGLAAPFFLVASPALCGRRNESGLSTKTLEMRPQELAADLVIIGGGLGRMRGGACRGAQRAERCHFDRGNGLDRRPAYTAVRATGRKTNGLKRLAARVVTSNFARASGIITGVIIRSHRKRLARTRFSTPAIAGSPASAANRAWRWRYCMKCWRRISATGRCEF